MALARVSLLQQLPSLSSYILFLLRVLAFVLMRDASLFLYGLDIRTSYVLCKRSCRICADFVTLPPPRLFQ